MQEQITEENLATFEGRDVEVMITGKLGKKDTDTHRVTGREKTGVLVHIGVPEGEPVPEIGDFVTATVTHAGRHNLLADPTWPPARPIPCGTEGGVYDATSRLHRRSHRVRQDGVGHRHRPASGRSGGAGRNRERGRYQMYRGMDIGTAKPTAEEQAAVPHHLIDIIDPEDTMSVARFQQLARETIADLQSRGIRPILVGGSGLYARAAIDDITFPGTDPDVRTRLEEREKTEGAGALFDELRAKDPEAAARMDHAIHAAPSVRWRSSSLPANRIRPVCRATGT